MTRSHLYLEAFCCRVSAITRQTVGLNMFMEADLLTDQVDAFKTNPRTRPHA